VNDEGNSAIDIGSQKLSQAISDRVKADLIADTPNWNQLNEAQQQEIITQAQNTGTYSSMAIMITLQVVIAAAMILLTAGAGSGSAASYTVNAATSTSKSAVMAALNAAKNAISANMEAITMFTKAASWTTQITKDLGGVGASGVQIDAALLAEEAAKGQADVGFCKAQSAFLNASNANLISLVQEMYQQIADSYQTVTSVLQAQHQADQQISTLLKIA
jgi:hypothetical protein